MHRQNDFTEDALSRVEGINCLCVMMIGMIFERGEKFELHKIDIN